MAKFIKAVECPNCGDLAKGDCVTRDLISPNGVICVNHFSCTSWICKNCGANIHTGNIDEFVKWTFGDV